MIATYDPARFIDINTVDDAVDIILCPTEGMTARQRWADETPAIMRILEHHIIPGTAVLDYGCGIGRLSKPLIDNLDCRVVGIDLSPKMRSMASMIVDSQKFFTLAPEMFDEFMAFDSPFNAAIAIWSLQHCNDLSIAIDRIACSLQTGGKLFILNNTTRCLPVENGEWADDGQDVNAMLLKSGFAEVERGVLDESVAPGWMQKDTFWAVYRRYR